MKRRKVVYVTGAPASGKSTLCNNVAAARPDIAVFSYSRELRTYVARRASLTHLSEEEIRRQSSKLVTRADVEAVDKQLADLLKREREQRHVIVDSHAVTKEDYGYRVTPFTRAQLLEVAPSLIAVLVVSAALTRQRIKNESMGRPLPSMFDADFHTNLQASVAFAYAFELGCPLYYLDASRDENELVRELLRLIDKD